MADMVDDNFKIIDFILEYDNFWNKETCDFAIKYFNDMKDSGLTTDRPNRSHDKSDNSLFIHNEDSVNIKHTKYLCELFMNKFWTDVYPMYTKNFSILGDYDKHTIYHLKLQETKPGQGYHLWHSENTSIGNSKRVLTFILYLNNIEDGGETEFLYYPKRIKPKQGTLILFPVGFTHTHRGNQPLTENKYVISGWLEF